LTVPDLRDTEVQLWARTGRNSGLPRYRDAYGHWLGVAGDDRMFVDAAREQEIGPQDPADPLVDVELVVHGLGLVEGRLAEVVGPDPARLEWWHYGWPAVPCWELGWQYKHAYVQVVPNAADIWATEPADGHRFSSTSARRSWTGPSGWRAWPGSP
jgi:hypothetical protein